jgi:hypothetical protein
LGEAGFDETPFGIECFKAEDRCCSREMWERFTLTLGRRGVFDELWLDWPRDEAVVSMTHYHQRLRANEKPVVFHKA